MAPVEPARAAAVALVATTGIILAALAIAKLKSNSKKQQKEESDDSAADDGLRETTASGIQSNGVDTELNTKSDFLHKNSKPEIYENGSKPSKEAPKELPESTQVSSNDRKTPEKDTTPKTSKIPRAKSTERTGPGSSKANAVDSGLLVQQVFKPQNEPEEQTIVSFAEIQFSPGSTPEKQKNVPKVKTVQKGLSSSPERRSKNMAGTTSKSPRVSPEKQTKSDPGSLDSSSFEVINVSSKRRGSGKKSSPSPEKYSGVGSDRAVMQTSFEEDFDPNEGAGESLALPSDTSDNGGGIMNRGPLDATGDGSFVLLDVATAPSNCKPDLNLVESLVPNQSELRQAVSLERLKSSGSDSGETGLAPDSPKANDDPYPNLSDDDIRETLNTASMNPGEMEMRHAQILVRMLLTNDIDLQEKLLAVIAKVATFTKNQNCLRKAGCIPRLTHLLKVYCEAVEGSVLPPTTLMNTLINSVTNLAVNSTNNTLMKDCVPPLADLILSSNVAESIQLSSLQALTNLSVTSDHNQQYTRLVQRLFDLVDSNNPTLQLQTLKVLVNLSCNKDMVPTLLAAKACHNLFFLLEMNTSESLVLRWSTLLANIMHTVRERQLTSTELPYVEKAASPETMYSALYSLNTSGQLRNKVFVLSKHPNEDIRYQAARIYSGLTKHSTV